MTRREFIDLIDFGSDIMFELDEKSYSIIGGADGGPNIAEQITENNEATFKNGKDLLDNYCINGETLRDCFERIKITYYC